MAGGQKGVTSPSPEPPVSEADSWKIEEPVVKSNAISTNSEQEAGWPGEIVEPVLEKSGTINRVWNRHILSKFSLTTKSLSESASSSCQR
jgi:hypothetical protein